MIHSNDPTYPLFPILSCLGFILSIIPLPWHIQAWNSGTCAFMLWTAALCLIKFVNSVIWAGNVDNVAPIWCDISGQIIHGATIGIPASSLCISRRLYKIASIRTVSVTREDKQRAVIQDLAIALGIPIIVLIMHIVVQPHRFDILEDIGCAPTTYNTLPAYFLFLMWPILLGAISLVYSCLNLRIFYIRRAKSNLMATSVAISTSRYLRLMTLALVDIIFTIPLGIYAIYIGTHGVPLQPWISWEDTHFDFWRVGLVPALIWRSNQSLVISVEFNRWLCVFCAFMFFALFGFASEAKKNYSVAFWWTASKFGFQRPAEKGQKGQRFITPKVHPNTYKYDTLPVYVIPDKASGKAKRADLANEIEFVTLSHKANGLRSPSRPSTLSSYSHTAPSSSSGSFVSLTDTVNLRHSLAATSDYRLSLSTDAPSPPTKSLIHEALSHHRQSQGDSNVANPSDQVYLSDVPSSESPAFPSSPPAAYHRPFSPPDTYPVAKPYEGYPNTRTFDLEKPTLF